MMKKNLASVDCAWQIRGKKYCAHDRVVNIVVVDIIGCVDQFEGGACNVTEYGGIVKYVLKVDDNFFKGKATKIMSV